MRRHYSIPLSNIYCAGDEVDFFHGKNPLKHAPDADASHTPNSELDDARKELRRWYEAFPTMSVCLSNHAERWAKRASEIGMPSQLFRPHHELLGAPDGWVWRRSWRVNGKHPFMIEHGHEGTPKPDMKALENGISTAYGHFTGAIIQHMTTRDDRRLWSMCVAALISQEAYAFKYAKASKRKADIGVGVVINDGRTPIWEPLV